MEYATLLRTSLKELIGALGLANIRIWLGRLVMVNSVVLASMSTRPSLEISWKNTIAEERVELSLSVGGA